MTWLPACLGPASIPGSCLHPWVLPAATTLAQAAPAVGRGHLTVFPHWLLSLPAISVSGRSLVLLAERGLVGKEPSPFFSPLGVSHSVGLEVGQQRPRPLDCLFLAPGVFVHGPGTHAGA